MHLDALPENTKNLLSLFKNKDFLDDFYLSGGTALSLQLGHRESEYLDFFTQNEFDPLQLQPHLEKLGKLSSVEADPGTLNLFLNDVKVQFLRYPYPLLESKINFEQIWLSSKIDIACTKLITISSRGSKKDFIDMYFLLQEYSLPQLFEKLPQKYPQTDYSEIHLLKSLLYFVAADDQPMPRMHQDVSWEKIRAEITRKVVAFQI